MALSRIPSAATGLGLKLGLGCIVLVSVIMGTTAWWTYRGCLERLTRYMHQTAESEIELILAGLEPAMLEGDPDSLASLAQQYAYAPDIVRVFVVEPDGIVSTASDPTWLGRLVSPPSVTSLPVLGYGLGVGLDRVSPVVSQTIEQGGKTVLRSFAPISTGRNLLPSSSSHPGVDGSVAGQRWLGVDFSLAYAHEAHAKMMRQTTLWAVGTTILVLMAIGILVQLRLLRPLRHLRDATHAVALGKSTFSVSISGNDELTELANDITTVSSSLRSTTEAFSSQHKLIHEIVGQMDDGFAVFDRSCNVIAANNAYVGGLEALAKQRSRHTESPAEAGSGAAFVLRTGRSQKRIFEHHSGDMDAVYEVCASPVTTSSGEVEYVVEIWRDMTERLMLETKLAHAEQLSTMGVLAAAFSHEISTPLGTIATTVQGALRQLKDQSSLDDARIKGLRSRLEVAREEVFRCRDITGDLLSLLRTGQATRSAVNINSVVSRMVKVVLASAKRRNIEVQWLPGTGLSTVDGYPEQIERLTLNLLVNALDAMPDGGALVVQTRPCEEAVEIVVSDTGVGIAAEDQDRIFDLFFTHKPNGTGLGLYLCKQISENHSGSIEVSSIVGKGTEVRVLLRSRLLSDEGLRTFRDHMQAQNR